MGYGLGNLGFGFAAKGLLAGSLLRNRAAEILANVGPSGGWAFDYVTNTLKVIDPITPANNFDGKCFDPSTGLHTKFTTTRAGAGATDLDIKGNSVNFAADVPRIGYTNKLAGLKSNRVSQNILLNSSVLVTQSPTVTAASLVLSFKGTGSITLSGASTAGPLAGTGANNIVQLVFTPTAGVLNCTVAGDVREANLELGSWRTPWIPTAGAPVTRSADSTTFSAFNKTVSGMLYAKFIMDGGTGVNASNRIAMSLNDGTAANRTLLYNPGAGGALGVVTIVASVTQGTVNDLAVADGIASAIACSLAINDASFVQDGRTPKLFAPAALPTYTQASIGLDVSGTNLDGRIIEGAFIGG